MKTSILLAVGAVTLLAGCAEPEPVVVHRHHYYERERVYTTPRTRPVKAAPSVHRDSPEGFRAVEQPSSYSQ